MTAVRYFEDAIAKQPDFAAAHSALAQTQLQFLFTGPWSPRSIVPKAEAAARRALQLDPALAAPHRVLGTILQNYYWRWEDGRAENRRASQLEESTAPNRTASASMLVRQGRFDEADAEFAQAQRTDPLSDPLIVAGTTYRAVGQLDRSVAALREAVRAAPTFPRTHFQLGLTLLRAERVDDAVAELEETVRLSGSNPRFQAALAVGYVQAGRVDDGRRLLAALESRATREYVSSFGTALIYDGLGQREQALAAFERAFEDRAIEIAQMSDYPPFKTIARDRLFLQRLQAIGGPAAAGGM